MIKKIAHEFYKHHKLLFVNFMAIRRIKQEKAVSKISKKLKASNFIQSFNIQDNIQTSATQKSNNNLEFEGEILRKLNKNRDIHKDKEKRANEKQTKSKSRSLQVKKRATNNKSERAQAKSLQISQDQSKQSHITEHKASPQLQAALKTLGMALDPINPKSLRETRIKEAAIIQNQQIQKAIAELKSLNLKDFSILVHRLLVNSSGLNGTLQRFLWKQIQQDFLRRFEVTADPIKIRSYSKIIYGLAKCKVHRNTSLSQISTSISTNLQSFETKFALLLPSATHQSYTTIITSLSRMGPLSQQFSYISERLYYSKYQQFNVRERVQINYALTRNGRQADSKLYHYIDSMNLKQIVTMLRCYQNCNQLYTLEIKNGKHKNLLSLAQVHIIARKREMNVIDIGEVCNIYFQSMTYNYRISQQLQKSLTQMYKILKSNINEVAFEKIWQNLPTVVNRGYLEVQFVQQIIRTLKIMRKKDLFPQRIWKPMRQSFKEFENLQIRTKLEQIK